MSRKLNTTIASILPVTTDCPYTGRPYSFLQVETVDGQRFASNENTSEANAKRWAAMAQRFIGEDVADLIRARKALDLVEVDPCYGSLAWGSEDEMALAAMEG